MIKQYNPSQIQEVLRNTNPTPIFPPASDRIAWMKVQAELAEEVVHLIVQDAERASNNPIAVIPASSYVAFERNGERAPYETVWIGRRRALTDLVIGECIEGQGRFLSAIVDHVWATCEESTWVMPAHIGHLPDPERHDIDLAAAMTALKLAEIDALFSDRLEPAVIRRIRHEIDRRCFTPYLSRHDYFWMYETNTQAATNWTAVCTAGVVGAALYVEKDLSRLAEMIARALVSVEGYLGTFDSCGGLSEGIGYWNYGFGYFALLAHLLEQRTSGTINLWSDSRVREIAQMPIRAMMSAPANYPTFSDCPLSVSLNSPLLGLLARRLDLPILLHLVTPGSNVHVQDDNGGVWGVRGLLWRAQRPETPLTLPKSNWFPDLQWFIARESDSVPSCSISLAVKGGHNGEMHNHNDVGSFIIEIAAEALIVDLGSGLYDKDYFGPGRYEHLATSSLGHSVPVVNGFAQAAGKEYAARLVARHFDTSGMQCGLTLDLAEAYPLGAKIASLKRTVLFHERDAASGEAAWVEIEDIAEFAEPTGRMISVLITLAEVDTAMADFGMITLRGNAAAAEVKFDSQTLSAAVETLAGTRLAAGPTAARRITFQLRQQSGPIRLEVHPLFGRQQIDQRSSHLLG